MIKERTDLGFADALEDFNPAEWKPKPVKAANDRPKPKADNAKKLEAIGFRSREPKGAASVEDAKAEQTQRRRRTGRNAQINLKAKPETIESFCAIADQQGWGLGETLEYAVAILKREYPA